MFFERLSFNVERRGMENKNENIQIFPNPEFGNIRTMRDEKGEPLFCLKDVCEVLDLRTQKVVQRLEDDVLSKYPIVDSLGRTQ